MAACEPLDLVVEADLGSLENARLRLLAHFGECPGLAGRPRTLYALELVLEEWLTNVFRHGTKAPVLLRVALDEEGLSLRFEDDGPAFDPTDRPHATRPASLEEAQPGGLGLFLIQHYARSWRYAREGQRNVMLIVIDTSGR